MATARIKPLSVPPQAHSLEMDFWLEELRDSLTEFKVEPSALTTYPPDVPPTTAATEDDEFTGTTLDLTKWTWDNLASPTPDVIATVGDSFLRLNQQGTGASSIASIVQATPSGDWRFRAKLHLDYDHTAYTNQSFGITVFCSDATLRVFRAELISATTIATGGIRVSKWYANRQTFDNVPGGASFQFPLNAPVYLEIENDSGASTLTTRWSTSGFDDFHDLAAVTHANIQATFTPDYIGLGVWGDNSKPFVGVCDWWRRMA